MSQTILNIAAGKILPLDLPTKERSFIVNVDPMFYYNTDPASVEKKRALWDEKSTKIVNIKKDIFEFMERTVIHFDRVTIYRFLEHVPRDRVLYFIYLISTITRSGAVVDVIVPDYEILAARLLSEEPFAQTFEEEDIILTTELLNEPSCPHASIWTRKRAMKFWELEKRFKVDEDKMEFGYAFDGRDIYLRFFAERI
jgi:hypothetical protein